MSEELVAPDREVPEARLRGHAEPHFDRRAKISFAEVLLRGDSAHRMGIALSYTDSASSLERAVEAAAPYCNTELLRRMHAYRDAVIETTMSGGEIVKVARADFVRGCLLALGSE